MKHKRLRLSRDVDRPKRGYVVWRGAERVGTVERYTRRCWIGRDRGGGYVGAFPLRRECVAEVSK